MSDNTSYYSIPNNASSAIRTHTKDSVPNLRASTSHGDEDDIKSSSQQRSRTSEFLYTSEQLTSEKQAFHPARSKRISGDDYHSAASEAQFIQNFAQRLNKSENEPAGNYIIRSLIDEYKTAGEKFLYKELLVPMLSDGALKSYQAALDAKKFPVTEAASFERIVCCLVKLSKAKYVLLSVSRYLMEWKKVLDEKKSHQEKNIDENSVELATDFLISYTILKMILSSGPREGSDLDSSFCSYAISRMKDLIFHLASSGTLRTNQELVIDNLAQILCTILGPKNMDILSSSFDGQITALLQQSETINAIPFVNAGKGLMKKANNVLPKGVFPRAGDEIAAHFMRCFRFASYSRIDLNFDSMAILLEHFRKYASSKNTSRAFKESLSSTISEILQNVDPKRLPDSENWDLIVSDLFQKFNKWVNAATRTITFPGYASLLSVQRESIYNSQISHFYSESLRIYIESKAKEQRLSILTGLLIVVENYLNRSPSSRTEKQLEEVMKLFSPEHNPYIVDLEDPIFQKIFVSLLDTVFCKSNVTFSVKLANYVIQQGDEQKKIFLKAYLKLFDAISEHTASLLSDLDQELPQSGDAEETNFLLLSPWSRLATSLMPSSLFLEFNKLVYELNIQFYRRVKDYVDRSIPIEKKDDITILELVLQAWFHAISYLPDEYLSVLEYNDSESEVNVIRLARHASPTIRYFSKILMEAFFLRYPQSRNSYLRMIGAMIMNLPLDAPVIPKESLKFLSRLINMWLKSLYQSSTMGDTAIDSNVILITERNALYMLIHPDPQMRRLAYDVLLAIRNFLHRKRKLEVLSASKVDSSKDATLTGKGPFFWWGDIVPAYCFLPLEKDKEVAVLLTTALPKNQKNWRKWLANTLRAAASHENCSESIHMLWEKLISLINFLKVRVEPQKKVVNLEIMKKQVRTPNEASFEWMCLWKNALAVSCSLMAVEPEAPRCNRALFRPVVDRTTVQNILRDWIIYWTGSADAEGGLPFLPSVDDARDCIYEAFQYVHPYSGEICLNEIMNQIEIPLGLAQENKKLKRRRDTLRLQVEFTYAHILRILYHEYCPVHVDNKCFLDKTRLHRMLNVHIRQTMPTVPQSPDQGQVRMYFSEVVNMTANVMYDSTGEQKMSIPIDVRKNLFRFFISVSKNTKASASSVISHDGGGEKLKLPDDGVPEIRAASALLRGPIDDKSFIQEVFKWAYNIFRAESHCEIDSIKKGLTGMIESNPQYRVFLEDLCYPTNRGIPEKNANLNFFGTLANLVEKLKQDPTNRYINALFPRVVEPSLLTLLIWNIGGDERLDVHFSPQDVRYIAAKTLSILWEHWFPNEDNKCPILLSSTLEEASESSQLELCSIISKRCPDLTYPICLEVCRRIESCVLSDEQRRKAIESLAYWIRVLPKSDKKDTVLLLRELLRLAYTYREDNRQAFEGLWCTFAVIDLEVGLNVLLLDCCKMLTSMKKFFADNIEKYYETVQLLEVYKSCALCFGRIQTSQTIDVFAKVISSFAKESNSSTSSKDNRYKDLSEPFSQVTYNEATISKGFRGDAGLVLISEIMSENMEQMEIYLAAIVHGALLTLTRPKFPYLHETCKKVLINSLHTIVVRQGGNLRRVFVPDSFASEFFEFEENLMKIRLDHPIYSSSRSIEGESQYMLLLGAFIQEYLKLISVGYPDFNKSLANYCIAFARRCFDYTFAVVTLHIYRCMKPQLAAEDSDTLIKGVSYCIKNTSSQKLFRLNLAVEIMKSLSSATLYLESDRLALFPEVFWISVGLLSCKNQKILTSCVKIMFRFVLDIMNDGSNSKVGDILRSTMSNSWEWYHGILPLLIEGHIASIDSGSSTSSVLFSLMTIPLSTSMKSLFDMDVSRNLMRVLVALFPWLCIQLTKYAERESSDLWSSFLDLMNMVKTHLKELLDNQKCDGGDESIRIFQRIVRMINKQEMQIFLDAEKPRNLVASWMGVACKLNGDERYKRLAQVFFQYARRSELLNLDDFMFSSKQPLAEALFPEFTEEFFTLLILHLKANNSEYEYVISRILLAMLGQVDSYATAMVNSGNHASLFKLLVQKVNGDNRDVATQVMALVIHHFGVDYEMLMDEPPPELDGDGIETSLRETYSRLDDVYRSFSKEFEFPAREQHPSFDAENKLYTEINILAEYLGSEMDDIEFLFQPSVHDYKNRRLRTGARSMTAGPSTHPNTTTANNEEVVRVQDHFVPPARGQERRNRGGILRSWEINPLKIGDGKKNTTIKSSWESYDSTVTGSDEKEVNISTASLSYDTVRFSDSGEETHITNHAVGTQSPMRWRGFRKSNYV